MTNEQESPPGLGLHERLRHHASGSSDLAWLPPLPIKYYTVAHIIQNNKILLGYKKRGFGQGKYNGFGGKVEPNETSLRAAVRELEEEAGIKAPLKHIGVLLFVVNGAEKTFHIDIYYAETFEGTITEYAFMIFDPNVPQYDLTRLRSDEMRPEWFSLSATDNQEDLPPIPWNQMWDTDRFWIPLLQEDRQFRGRVDFDKDEKGAFILRKWWYGLLEE